MTVVLEVATKPGHGKGLGRGDVALAGVMDVDRGRGFAFFTEPELDRLADRLDATDRIVTDGGTWCLDELAAYVDESRVEDWRERMLDVRAWMLSHHERALGVEEIAEGTTGLRRLGPEVDVGELVEAGKLDAAVEGLRAGARLTREVFYFGREMGYVGVPREERPGFERLEVDW